MDEILTNLRKKETVYLVNIGEDEVHECRNYVRALEYIIDEITCDMGGELFPLHDDITESYIMDLLKSRIKKVTKTTQYEGLKK